MCIRDSKGPAQKRKRNGEQQLKQLKRNSQQAFGPDALPLGHGPVSYTHLRKVPEPVPPQMPATITTFMRIVVLLAWPTSTEALSLIHIYMRRCRRSGISVSPATELTPYFPAHPDRCFRDCGPYKACLLYTSAQQHALGGIHDSYLLKIQRLQLIGALNFAQCILIPAPVSYTHLRPAKRTWIS